MGFKSAGFCDRSGKPLFYHAVRRQTCGNLHATKSPSLAQKACCEKQERGGGRSGLGSQLRCRVPTACLQRERELSAMSLLVKMYFTASTTAPPLLSSSLRLLLSSPLHDLL